MTSILERPKTFVSRKDAKAQTKEQTTNHPEFLKAGCGGEWKLSGSRRGFDAGARRTTPGGVRAPPTQRCRASGALANPWGRMRTVKFEENDSVNGEGKTIVRNLSPRFLLQMAWIKKIAPAQH